MKNKKLLVIPASLFITGCQHALLTTAVCPTQTVTVTPNCHDAATPRRELTINVNMPQLQAVPPIVCANVGKPIEVKIRPMNSGVAVITVPKNPSDDWIYAGNTPDQNSMTINVP
ncbi:MAG: hypothetical protein GTO41_02895, partial [Burkholderiales bacterium]|nr:hypothetical protein [Burkholderiales bacterium]